MRFLLLFLFTLFTVTRDMAIDDHRRSSCHWDTRTEDRFCSVVVFVVVAQTVRLHCTPKLPSEATRDLGPYPCRRVVRIIIAARCSKNDDGERPTASPSWRRAGPPCSWTSRARTPCRRVQECEDSLVVRPNNSRRVVVVVVVERHAAATVRHELSWRHHDEEES